MKISTHDARIKAGPAGRGGSLTVPGLFFRALIPLGPLLWGLAPCPGCAARVAVAPFPARPDTVSPGSLHGPFDGQVVDQQSGNPIPAALILGTWVYERRGALPMTAITQSTSVLTKSD